MVVLSVVSVFFIPKVATEESAMMKAATEQKAVNSNNLPGFGDSQPQQQAAPAGQAPAQQAPAQYGGRRSFDDGGGAEAFLRIIKDRSTKEHKEGIDFRKRNLKNLTLCSFVFLSFLFLFTYFQAFHPTPEFFKKYTSSFRLYDKTLTYNIINE